MGSICDKVELSSMKVLLTGASKGIGKFLSKEMSYKGYEVYGTYNKTKPEPIANCQFWKVDVRNEEEVKNWIEELPLSKEDKICLINCAGINYNTTIHKADSECWKRVIESNLYGVFHCIKCLTPVMREAKFGRIINFSSVVPKIGIPGTSAYSASKAALWGLSKAVAAENAKHGVTINTINLGYFDVGMITEVPKDLLNGIIRNIPLGKLGDPVSILNTVEYLIKTEYLTGCEINVNGGMW